MARRPLPPQIGRLSHAPSGYYLRVSTIEQTTANQERELRRIRRSARAGRTSGRNVRPGEYHQDEDDRIGSDGYDVSELARRLNQSAHGGSSWWAYAHPAISRRTGP